MSPGLGHVDAVDVSADGTLIVFETGQPIDPDDDNARTDIYLHDARTGTTTLISRDLDGGIADGDSRFPSISADGAYISYDSDASDLVAGDTNGFFDVFLYDMAAGTTSIISIDADGGPTNANSLQPALDADGSRLAFASLANGIVDTAVSGFSDVYVYDRINDTMTVASLDTGGGAADNESFQVAISDDGTTVAFQSRATDLVANPDTNAMIDVFVHDLDSSATELVSVDLDGNAADGESLRPTLSADGSLVAFSSSAADLAAGDTNGTPDVFLRDRNAGDTTIVSLDTSDGPADDESLEGFVSSDGSTVAFKSRATDIVPGVGLSEVHVYSADLSTGDITILSVTPDGDPANSGSSDPVLNSDGTTAVFMSAATDIDPADVSTDRDAYVSEPNRAPFVEPLSISVDELTVGPVGEVTASDAESDALAFAIASGDPDTVFSIDSAGILSAVGKIDFETTTQHVLDVVVSDPTHDVSVAVTIDVVDIGGQLDVVVDPNANSFDDDDGTTFEDDIEWLAAAGITLGCEPRLFCPLDDVTRGQMAAFLNRALDLPATGTDFFDDDDGTTFEDDINRLAASGITQGCDTGRFCPSDDVTRGQMAAFLNRALDLPATGTDFFDDDDGTTFEDDINRLAASGITQGCDTGRFCPSDNITRGQMAAFLNRALG